MENPEGLEKRCKIVLKDGWGMTIHLLKKLFFTDCKIGMGKNVN